MKLRFDAILSCSVLVTAFGVCGCANMQDRSNIPDTLAAPANQVLALEAMATGVQIYECKANGDSPSKFQWVLKAPEADLYDSNGSKIGRHYAGPTWEALDGSKVVGEVKEKYTTQDSSAIQWLLLGAQSNSGKGIFSRTATIQRVNTRGGKAPTEGCGQAQAGKVSRVPYTATYNFYNPKP